ncbi:hypothetical protein DIPPA_23051 [Diplonema papillatum]|nr:hypothetical protein DIPPA_23051 [Diplonema papillatum]
MGCASSSQAPRAQSPQKQDRNDHGVAGTHEVPEKGGSPSAKDAKNVNEVKPAAPHDASKVDAAPAANAAGSGPELHLARVSVNCHGPWILLRAAGVEHQLLDLNLMTWRADAARLLEDKLLTKAAKQDRDDHRVAETQRKGSSPSAKDAKNVNEVKPAAPAEPASPHDASKVDSAPTANAAELHLARVSVNCHGPWILLRAAGIEHHLADVDQMTGAQMQPDFLKINYLLKQRC